MASRGGWRMRNDLAVAMVDACRRHGVDADVAALAASILRSEIARRAPTSIARSGVDACRRWAEAAVKDYERISWETT